MTDTHETIADIIAEMRKTKYGDAECEVKWCLTQWADRLEAAHKRERGDAAKLREALNRLVIASEGFLKTHSAKYYVDTTEALDKAKAALAAPPRNCDVGTPEEQNARHNQFCYAQMKRNNHCCGPCPCHKFINGEAQSCTLLWAQMPYEEGGEK